jgi:hypothetical protein
MFNYGLFVVHHEIEKQNPIAHYNMNPCRDRLMMTVDNAFIAGGSLLVHSIYSLKPSYGVYCAFTNRDFF